MNNLIGFTTDPAELHSTRFATDVAKRLPVPILHVNGENVAAVVRAGQLAAEYRRAFKSDVVVDLIGYRRYGHSEVDDPTVTHPTLYARIKDHPPLSRQYGGGDRRGRRAVGSSRTRSAYMRHRRRRPAGPIGRHFRDPPSTGIGIVAVAIDSSTTSRRQYPRIGCGRSATELTRVPSRLSSASEDRAFVAATLRDGRWKAPGRLRYCGNACVCDASRRRSAGAFERAGLRPRDVQSASRGARRRRRRTAVLPARADRANGARFEVYNSPLSEAAVLGFEYGYSRDYPETLVLWEAQFGDFANNAQVIIDQFIASAEDKWRRLSGLTLLLPHGYEGQGPEHSSARVERFLQLAAEDNLQICQPSTAVQYFHVLRRQALTAWRTPLVIFTPKSLLRHSSSSSPISAFAQQRFLRVLADHEVSDARRVLLCTGKIGHELRAERARRARRTRQPSYPSSSLCPFRLESSRRNSRRYSKAKDFVWVQEEPANMGARAFMMPRLRRLLDGRPCVRCGVLRLRARPPVQRKRTTSNSRRCSRWRSEMRSSLSAFHAGGCIYRALHHTDAGIS